jgi:hypothetical protein
VIGVGALIAWVVTAALGSNLLRMWIARGGIVRTQSEEERQASSVPPPYFPAPLTYGHFLLAVTGLVIWVVYLVVDASVLAWVAFSLLLVVDLFGFSMFGRWLGSRRIRVAAPDAGARDGGPAESHLPMVVVFGHGLFASVTLLLVLASAAGVGG